MSNEFTIQDALEAEKIIKVLSLSAGYDLSFASMICVRPIGEDNFPQCTWEVDWTDWDDNKHYKEFETLSEAVIFFLQKRKELNYGIDFEKKMALKGNANV